MLVNAIEEVRQEYREVWDNRMGAVLRDNARLHEQLQAANTKGPRITAEVKPEETERTQLLRAIAKDPEIKAIAAELRITYKQARAARCRVAAEFGLAASLDRDIQILQNRTVEELSRDTARKT
jgi:hypothetical protein